jgi:hypothetical protein
MGLAGPNHHLVLCCFAGFLARVHELYAVWRPLCPTRLCSSAIIGASRPSTSDFSHRSKSPARLTEKARCLPSRDRLGPTEVLPVAVIAWPLSARRPRVASNGKSQLRVCCDFAVNANRRPSLETAKSKSGPDPVVSRSIAVARNVPGSMASFQILTASLLPHSK